MAIDFSEMKFDSAEWQKIMKRVHSKWDDIKHRKEFGGLVSAIVYQDIDDHFDKEMGPDGKWEPWSASYVMAIQGRAAWRYVGNRLVMFDAYQVEEYGIKPPRKMGKILQATGRLRNSFKPTSWKNKDNGVIFINKAKTKDGFPYAKANNAGGPKLPQRQFMWFSPKGLKKLADITLKWLSE